MSSSANDPQGGKSVDGALQIPDRAAFDTVDEYDANVKKYWKAIGRYRDLASELHGDIMKGSRRRPDRSKAEDKPK
jgi:hypothetical protein